MSIVAVNSELEADNIAKPTKGSNVGAVWDRLFVERILTWCIEPC